MDHESYGVFNDPETFAEYYAQTSERLRLRWEERVEFIQGCLERLRPLERLADVLEDEELIREVEGSVQLAQRALAALEAAALPAAAGAAPAPARQATGPQEAPETAAPAAAEEEEADEEVFTALR